MFGKRCKNKSRNPKVNAVLYIVALGYKKFLNKNGEKP
jgi:hypothetical protein